jgi:hypothetical protein
VSSSVLLDAAMTLNVPATGIKAGTKVRNIRLVNGVDGHDIDCKVDGIGPMQFKSSAVGKAWLPSTATAVFRARAGSADRVWAAGGERTASSVVNVAS